ncbi:hypothetical protein D0C36_21765 [Mucilaginibacter conchicola]|uniref:Uncharacterized protein n=1 Tax=Mucilaginibacter conchicola TaxID=2303333 RepID=A0A372NNA3_9SPHI|nr:hypothetical protein [Mucilaginibacter conchicola]RFZ90422.1 hypothetical protein D0C36_21765 [Mucilaginibacter conchicola]
MNTKTLAITAIASVLLAASCKIDAPVLPEGLVVKDGSVKPTNPGGGTTPTTPDPGTDATYTVGIGADDTFIYQIDNGPKVTLHNVSYANQDPDPDIDFLGNTNLSAHSLDSKQESISFSVGVNDATGIFPIKLFSLKSTTLDYEIVDKADEEEDTVERGSVKFTYFTEDAEGFDVIKGYFKVNVIDKKDGSKHVITGSYNTGS